MPKKLAVSAEFDARDNLSPAVKRMQRTVERFSRRSSANFNKVNVSTKSLFKGLAAFKIAQVGVRAVGRGLLGVGGIVKDTIQVGAQYEKSLDTVAAKMGGIKRSSEAYKTLGTTARKIGRDTEFSAVRAAQGLEFLAMAGFRADQAVAGLPKVVDLATVGSVGFARATDIASDTLGAFNLMSQDTPQLMKNLTRVNDVMARTVTSSNTTLELLFETFKQAGPTGLSLGYSIETVSALAGKLADAGIKGERAGTTLKNIFVRLSSPAPAKTLGKIGVAVTDSSGKFRDINEILGDLDKSLSKLSDKKRTAIINKVFGRIPLAGVNVLLKTGKNRLDAFRKRLERSEGAADRMAKQIRGNTAGSFAAMASKIADLKLTFFQALLPLLNSLMPKITGIINKVSAWAATNKNLISQDTLDAFKSLIWALEKIWWLFTRIVKAIKAAIDTIKVYFERISDVVNFINDPIGHVKRKAAGMREVQRGRDLYAEEKKIQQANTKLQGLQTQLQAGVRAQQAFGALQAQLLRGYATSPFTPIAERMVTKTTLARTEQIQTQTQKQTVEVDFKNIPDWVRVKKTSPRRQGASINLRTGRTKALAPVEAP